MQSGQTRRPLTSRDTSWAKLFAKWLTKRGASPNSISVGSVIFAAIAACALFAYGKGIEDTGERNLVLFLVILGVLGRLLCNLFDGMVAIEGGRKSADGDVYNDLPDRVSDVLIFVMLGHAAAQGGEQSLIWLQMGWAAACVAVLTAYIRYLGASCGLGHFFFGPMAKQQRMAVVIASTLLSAVIEPHALAGGYCYRVALVLIVVGGLLTCILRTRRIVGTLNAATNRTAM